MSDPIKDLQSKLRVSQDPISTFYLIETPSSAERMLEKMRLLSDKGVTETDIASIAQLVNEVLRQESPNQHFKRQFVFSFRLDGTSRTLPGLIELRNLPGQGYEVELMMPVGHENPDRWSDEHGRTKVGMR